MLLSFVTLSLIKKFFPKRRITNIFLIRHFFMLHLYAVKKYLF